MSDRKEAIRARVRELAKDSDFLNLLDSTTFHARFRGLVVEANTVTGLRSTNKAENHMRGASRVDTLESEWELFQLLVKNTPLSKYVIDPTTRM